MRPDYICAKKNSGAVAPFFLDYGIKAFRPSHSQVNAYGQTIQERYLDKGSATGTLENPQTRHHTADITESPLLKTPKHNE